MSFFFFISFSFGFLLFYVIINFYKKYFIIIIFFFFFFMKIIFIFSCSGMFRDVPECYMFLVLSSPVVNMVMQIQVQIGDTRRVFFCESAWECWGFTFLREIPKTRFMDFGILYENDKGEYVVLNDVRMAGIRLA